MIYSQSTTVSEELHLRQSLRKEKLEFAATFSWQINYIRGFDRSAYPCKKS